MNTSWYRTLNVAAWLGLASCSDEIAVLGHFHAIRDASTKGMDAADSGTATVRDAGPAVGDALGIERSGRAEFCAGSGSALRVGSAASCHPGIGRRLFRYGLCACSDLSATQSLSTLALDAFDSRNGPFDMSQSSGAPGSGAALGIDGALRVGNVAVAVNGTAIVAGGGALMLSNTISFGVSADFKTNASIDSAAGGVFSVGRDLWSDGDIHAGPTSNVNRDLYQTPGHSGADTLIGVGGSRQTRSFTIAPVCDCGLDVAALVTEAQRVNDNAELGVSAAALSDNLQQGIAPACGRFFVDGVSLPAGVLRTLSGRLALFVAGDLTLQGDFASDLAAQAELDVFVSGDLIVRGSAQIGMPARPSALRLYIAGRAAIEISDRVTFAAQIYAPQAAVNVTSPLPVAIVAHGSIVAASFDIATFFTTHYDRAVAELGERCDGAPPPRCDRCEQCPSGLACVDGACAACRTDADCCEPFGCLDGKCQPLIYAAPMK